MLVLGCRWRVTEVARSLFFPRLEVSHQSRHWRALGRISASCTKCMRPIARCLRVGVFGMVERLSWSQSQRFEGLSLPCWTLFLRSSDDPSPLQVASILTLMHRVPEIHSLVSKAGLFGVVESLSWRQSQRFERVSWLCWRQSERFEGSKASWAKGLTSIGHCLRASVFGILERMSWR